MSEGRVIRFKSQKRWKMPDREEIARAAESASRTFLNLALLAEMTAKALRAVSNELGDPRRRRGRID